MYVCISVSVSVIIIMYYTLPVLIYLYKETESNCKKVCGLNIEKTPLSSLPLKKTMVASWEFINWMISFS